VEARDQEVFQVTLENVEISDHVVLQDPPDLMDQQEFQDLWD